MEITVDTFISIVEEYYLKDKFFEIHAILTDDMLNEFDDATLYAYKSLAFKRGAENLKMKFAQKAVELKPSSSIAYLALGSAWSFSQDKPRALEEYNKALKLDKNCFLCYASIAGIQHWNKEYELALINLNKSIELNDQYSSSLVLRSVIWGKLGEHLKALDDINRAFKLENRHLFLYNNRAIIYKELEQYQKAIDDYNIFLKKAKSTNTTNVVNSDLAIKFAVAEVARMKKILADEKFKKATHIANEIKKVLQYKGEFLTHYTNLTNGKALIVDGSKIRISEATFLNDNSEGKALLNYLTIQNQNITTETFTRKPFIGSFVASEKQDDLTLWRMYGKDYKHEANGLSITIFRQKFIDNIEKEFGNIFTGGYNFYKVAYWDKKKFIIPGSETTLEEEENLNNLLNDLKEMVKDTTKAQRKNLIEILNEIAYLFKTGSFQDEHEIRFAIDGVAFSKGYAINENDFAPKVYIELIEITSILANVTLGPKLERSSEWATFLNYYFNEIKISAEVVMSYHPYK